MSRTAPHTEHPETTTKPKKPEALYDPIFFRKDDLKVGTELLYMGRLAPKTRWTIVEVKTDLGRGRGMKIVDGVRTLNDYLTLRSASGEIRRMSFAYASYSAIWQLPRATLKRVK
jgi:hypothetical protein